MNHAVAAQSKFHALDADRSIDWMLYCVVLFSDTCIKHHADCRGLCHMVGVGDILDYRFWIFRVSTIARMAGNFGIGNDCGRGHFGQHLRPA